MKPDLNCKDIVGEYYLKGVHEMASGFKFDSDFTFQFFYIYGASDRSASGKFEIVDNKIILHGQKIQGKDFNLIGKKHLGNGYSVAIIHDNKLLSQNVICYFSNINETITKETNQNGIASAQISDCKKIELIHSYFPDIPTALELIDDENNYFEFSLNTSLQEVVFDNCILDIEKESLMCSNIYLFGQNPVRFVKQ
jgi:hypothetical protein